MARKCGCRPRASPALGELQAGLLDVLEQDVMDERDETLEAGQRELVLNDDNAAPR